MDKKVLYIEDNEDNRRLVQKVLLAQGYQVLLATDGKTGCDMIETCTPDVVLLDISLPGELDGLAVVEKTKKLKCGAHPWFIAVTASAMPGDREHFLSHGCDDYISKPISLHELLGKIREVVG
ncbi:MAG: response regulator [Anaerolineae bacterium]|nr:response regulator [Anaerolineae bacterium]